MKDNVTRFVVLSRDPLVASDALTSAAPYKTSIVFSLQEGPGMLFKALSVFALRDIDMTKIESRPMRANPLILSGGGGGWRWGYGGLPEAQKRRSWCCLLLGPGRPATPQLHSSTPSQLPRHHTTTPLLGCRPGRRRLRPALLQLPLLHRLPGLPGRPALPERAAPPAGVCALPARAGQLPCGHGAGSPLNPNVNQPPQLRRARRGCRSGGAALPDVPAQHPPCHELALHATVRPPCSGSLCRHLQPCIDAWLRLPTSRLDRAISTPGQGSFSAQSWKVCPEGA
jgi:hypothetical protein